jgi:hypothetical protein
MSFLICSDGANLLKNLKMDRHKRLNLDDTKFTTPQDTCQKRMTKKARKKVKVETKTGEGRISCREINYGIF